MLNIGSGYFKISCGPENERKVIKTWSNQIFCDPLLEPSCQDGSNEGSQHMFSWRNKKNYLWIILNTPSYSFMKMEENIKLINVSNYMQYHKWGFESASINTITTNINIIVLETEQQTS